MLASKPPATLLCALPHLCSLLIPCRPPRASPTSVQTVSHQVPSEPLTAGTCPCSKRGQPAPLCPAPLLQKCETDTLENGRQLTYGDYRDASRALRRSLKQLGSGALKAGIRQLTASEAAAEEVAALIGVDAQVRGCTWTSVELGTRLGGASASGRWWPVRLLRDVDAQASGAQGVLSRKICVSLA